MNIKFFKISGLIFVIFLASVYSYITFFPEQTAQSNLSNKEVLLTNFKNELKDINQQLPKDIDSFTTLTSVDLEKDLIINRHTIKQALNSEISTEELYNKIKEHLINTSCNNGAYLLFFENDIKLKMSYLDTNNKQLFEITLDQTSCE